MDDPVPAFILENPTYASWFDALPFQADEAEVEWITLQILSKREVILWESPPLEPKALVDWIHTHITIPYTKGVFANLFYFRRLGTGLVFSGQVRVDLRKGLNAPPSISSFRGTNVKVKSLDLSIKKLFAEYKTRLRTERDRSIRASRDDRYRNARYPSSGSVRPNESISGPFLHRIENQDEFGNYVLNVNSQINRVLYSRVWSGVRTPNFAKLKGKGRLPVNAHTVRMYVESGGEFMRRATWPQQPLWYSFTKSHISTYYGLPGAPSHTGRAYELAARRIAEKASGIKANLAQDLVQYRQTTNLISDNVSRIWQALKATRKGNFREALKHLEHSKRSMYAKNGNPSRSESLASNWLMIQYGWKPLLSDIHESISLISKWNNDPRGPRAISRVSASGTSKSSTVSDIAVWGYPAYRAGTQKIESSTRAKIAVYYRQSSRVTSYLAQTGFTNPLNLAWEVLPYSFVLDWLLPVGPWLETLSAWDGLEFESGFVTQFTRQNVHTRIDYNVDLSGSVLREEGKGSWSREDVVLDRSALTSFPQQYFPSFKNPVSITHALNALALLTVGFRSSARIRD